MRRIVPAHFAVISICLSCILLASCATTTAHRSMPTATPTLVPTHTPLPPAHYTTVLLTQGFGSPDDLTLDAQGRVIFADFGNNGVNRIEQSGQITVLARGFPEPEGIVALPDGTLFIAVQGKDNEHIDRIERLAPGSATPTIIATYTNATTQPGIDGLSMDPRTGDLIVADSPNGTVYRLSQDGARQSVLVRGLNRPTHAIFDSAGDLFVVDEYGNDVARYAPTGAQVWQQHFSFPDDAAFDIDGSLLITVLGYNTVVRLDPATGRTLATLATDLFEPQGLAVDPQGNIYVSEQRANKVIELRRG